MEPTAKGAGTASLAQIVLATEVRRRWRSLALLAALAVLWAAVTMSAIAGARRTASVVDRFQRETLASHATFAIPTDFDGRDLYRALLANPAVRTGDLQWSAATGLAYDDRGIFVNLSAGVTGVRGHDLDRPIVLRGRAANLSNPDEVMVTTATADLLDVEPGDHLDIPTWDKTEWLSWQKERGDYPPFDGPLVHVTVVGVVRMASDLTSTQETAYFVVTTPAFVERWGSLIGPNESSVIVAFNDPDLDPTTLLDSVTASVGKQVYATSTDDDYAAHLRDAVSALTVGLLVLAGAAGLTGALLVGFAVAREVRRSAVRHEPLEALGATRRQRAVAFSAPIVLVAVVVSVLSVVGAALLSRWFPVGPARRAEPARGSWLDVPVLAAGPPVVMLVMLAAAAFVSVRSISEPAVSGRGVARFTSFLGRVGPAATVGLMNAIGSRERRSTLVAAVVTIVGLTSTASFAVGLRELGDRPERWGYTWSSSPELDFAASKYRAAIRSTLADPDVQGVAQLVSQKAIVGGRSIPISTFNPEGGQPIQPLLFAGRMPFQYRQIALGRRTADALGVGIGDTVQINSAILQESIWYVVGLVVPPTLLSTTNPGEGAFTNPFSFGELFGDGPVENYLAIKYRSGVDAGDVEARLSADLGWFFGARSHARQPGAIASLTGVSVLLPWLVGFFVALGFGATALAAVRRGTPRGRDVRILRALGFTPRDIRRCALAEALTIAGIGVLVGCPLGLLVGRKAWQLTTGDLGVDATQPSLVPVLLGVVGIAALAALIASLSGARRAVALASAVTSEG